ncbi:hypothetical protein [Marinibactrum halimedae]|uniref:DUF669 domain-containing protein n=1 Tax=Marinibactrum halimedae TaxID=1444977 RepID=A0AA37T8W9_9GAMM|nr:hypothetical protein [Marinibactrum halimedae]MCD9458919.1 hypothetical protein [Marinibactrum halimedae]GLS27766.1 hypothetical protein GCM10007877_34850 [Marinibactrum halimedae]
MSNAQQQYYQQNTSPQQSHGYGQQPANQQPVMTPPAAISFNAEAARQGEGGSNRIDTTGAYAGLFTKAKHIQATTGTIGIEFEFEDSSGATARMTLYLVGKDGSQLRGGKTLQAMMLCMGVQQTIPVNGMVKEYDFDSKSEVERSAFIYPELLGKPIGLLIQMEEYEKQDKTIGRKPNIYAPFNAKSRQTSVELLDQAPAQKLDKMLQSVTDKLLPKNNGQSQQQNSGFNSDPNNDNIPF